MARGRGEWQGAGASGTGPGANSGRAFRSEMGGTVFRGALGWRREGGWRRRVGGEAPREGKFGRPPASG
ncbi:hypothetical protein GCM10010361_57410 [Streptomyces olivaceiscleroticus]|uniref:Uncharacterized protein n=1 Tax=Streptomyces olivaceiscleroticus TaxID=68245 RepID=A0ABN1AW04_9ACTN